MIELVTSEELAQIAYKAGAGFSAAEIATSLGITERRVRDVLGLVGIELSAKPFGKRSIRTNISRRGWGALRTLAIARGIRSENDRVLIAEMLLKATTEDLVLADNVISDGVNTLDALGKADA